MGIALLFLPHDEGRRQGMGGVNKGRAVAGNRVERIQRVRAPVERRQTDDALPLRSTPRCHCLKEVALGVMADYRATGIREQVGYTDGHSLPRSRAATEKDMAIVRQADQGALKGAPQDKPSAGKHPGGTHRLFAHPGCATESRPRSAPAPAGKQDSDY